MNFIRKFSTSNSAHLSFSSLLKSRGLISIAGKDAINVLQGITTNNMKIFSQEKKRVSLHTCFLSSTGRIIADALVLRPSIAKDDGPEMKEDEFWLDVEQSQIERLTKHLKMYSLRKKIEITDLSKEMKIFAVNNPFVAPDQSKTGMDISELKNGETKREIDDEYDTYEDMMFVDPRCHLLGARIVIFKEDEFEFESPDGQKLMEVDENVYNRFRLLNGICQGEEVQDIIPFQANFDLLKSINLDKGCYLGQELMARAYYTGVVRKRMFPFVVSKMSNDESLNEAMLDSNSVRNDLKNKVIINEKGEQMGKVLFNRNNVGIGLFNYLGWKDSFSDIEKGSDIKLKLDDMNCVIARNEWFFEKLAKYVEFIKEKNLTI